MMLKRLRVAYLGGRGELGLPITITKDKSGFDLLLEYSQNVNREFNVNKLRPFENFSVCKLRTSSRITENLNRESRTEN